MTALQLVIAPAAKHDLKGIYQYGLHLWGQIQSNSFLTSIKDQFWSLTEQPLMGIERPELLPDIRSLAFHSHTLFYLATESQVEIIQSYMAAKILNAV